MAVNSTALLLAKVTYITVEIVIGLCAIVGNVLVIWVVKLNPSLQTTTFYFIVSLALADIAVGVLVMPLAIVISLGITIHFYNCLFMTCLLLIFTHASIMSLLAIAVDRYLRVKLTVRSRIPGTPGHGLSFQLKVVHFLPVMGSFILLFWTVLSDAMVMDEKVKESSVLDMASATCSYNTHYKDHPKYWCQGYFRDYCTIIAFTPNSTDRVALRDTGSQLIIAVSCLTKEDAGWYWCGIQRDFARDDMDSTELVVTDNRGGLASDFWSGKNLSDKNTRSCRASGVVHKADRSRMSILIICILITGLEIITIISHLSKRRRSQRNRRVDKSLKPSSCVLTPQKMVYPEQM
ncbi:transmembrane domain-containing protein TMIGD3 isoform X1 [Zalophus californianus]|uniref:Transmembrane domain-containing protein TMIGD3 isoform X1 n=1 Tax=Zalophus californianus TaxID=9704 RepID=A0A6J2BL22_ZALCA|nr:transmembrane domain-containing protein TMIGD3 isoform X1 [Zalophus californianus]